MNYRSKAAGAPFTTVGHLGAAVSPNLDENAVPATIANGISAVLKRDFPTDTFPASFAYGAMYPIGCKPRRAGRSRSTRPPASPARST